jgi:hypothetical protein
MQRNIVNDFVPFALDEDANVLPQEQYLEDLALGPGFQRGILLSATTNKVWRQSSFISAGIAQWVFEELMEDVLDDGDLPAFVEQLRAAFRSYAIEGPQGPAGTMEVGTVTTGAAGSEASITNSGTDSQAVLDFTIPQGIQGVRGPMGPGLRIQGFVDTEADLPTSARQGDIWFAVDTRDGFVWNARTQQWVNVGPIQQPDLSEIDGGEYFADGEE